MPKKTKNNVNHPVADSAVFEATQASATGVLIPANGVFIRRYLRPKVAAKKLGIADSTLWLKIKTDPDFPQPIKIGPNTTVLIEDEIDHYVSTRSREAR
ncbi:helix-turn-helix transcriptional regulator [Noviherbaspirillum autotrophicum]|uniref:helix-turn-helix transcriptional regulator n=1 Tax=Noviherbaspirillum autotrophicum TaxID=709839 RepID=UPI0009FDC19B|nr:AlpA family phage regulatory protein [Noviherbaspirillum autotrophicum]